MDDAPGERQAPDRVTSKAAVRRPRSPAVKHRARKHPPAGVADNLDKVPPEVPSDLSDIAEGCPPNLLKLNLRMPEGLGDWSAYVRDLFKVRATFTDLGRHLLELLSTMPTPLGNFVRSYCLAAQPTTPGVVCC